MDIMGYQAVTDEMVPKERRAWQVLLDHVVWREKPDQVVKTLNTGTGSSARGRIATEWILGCSRYFIDHEADESVNVFLQIVVGSILPEAYLGNLNTLAV